jgi:4-hydroxybenzoate polyprenyltransferase
MVFARSAAMSFNRIVDRDVDAENPRTANRHLPRGVLSVRSVRVFTWLNSLGFVASTLLFWPNWLPLLLSVPVLLFLFGYSYTKRFTALSHFWLGTALMLAPLSAWIAIRGEYLFQAPADILPALVLGAAVLFWVAGFDVIYACQDTDFDRRASLHSLPARWGNANALRLAASCHLGMIACLLVLPLVLEQFGWFYWTGILAVAALLSYEHWIVRPDDLSRVNVAFFQVNAIVSFGLLLVGTVDLLI